MRVFLSAQSHENVPLARVRCATLGLSAIGIEASSALAWYQAGAAQAAIEAAYQSGATTSITADSNITYAVGEYHLKFTIAEKVSTSSLLLTEWDSSAASGQGAYVTYFIDPAGVPRAGTVSGVTGLDTPGSNNKVATKVFVVYAELLNASDDSAVSLDATALASFHATNENYTCKVTASAEDGATTPVAHTVHIGSADKNTAEGSHFTDATNAKVVFTVNPSTAVPGSSILVDPMTTGTGSWTGAKACVGYVIISVDGGAHESSSNKTVTTGDVTVTFDLDEDQ